jgi:hypothetical protein
MNYSLITLGELLSSENETIKRNAVSILKVLQKRIDTSEMGGKEKFDAILENIKKKKCDCLKPLNH